MSNNKRTIHHVCPMMKKRRVCVFFLFCDFREKKAVLRIVPPVLGMDVASCVHGEDALAATTVGMVAYICGYPTFESREKCSVTD
jgi:hypothetical protein